ncbi:MAG: carboxypeptidase regulatory-like domain-containing protein [Armatimonadetes bacterium]|nr:carboxypeptidase regulatory-like domain-containing protein [Armatimonadota bacterium]
MRRVNKLAGLMATALPLLLAGCGGGGGVVALAVVRGIVTNALGVALSGVSVKSGSATAVSGADGSYTLSVAPGTNLKITASRAGSVDTFEVLTLAAGQSVPLDFSLNPVGQSTPVTGLLNTPATVTDPRGGEVRLGANTVVDANGAPVDAVTVAVTTALPTDAKFAASFPGSFVGTKAGVDAAIESFGFVTIAITSNAGNPCNLAPGATADLALPVDPAADPGTPTIDLWSLNETTGKWVFEAAAARDASGGTVVYRATVSHFSSWNLDAPIPASIPLTVTVRNAGGSLVSGASVVVSAADGATGAMWEGRGVTDANGTAFFPALPQANSGFVDATVRFGDQLGTGSAYTITNNAASMTIPIYKLVTRTFTLVYLNNGVQTPIPNQLAEVDQITGFLGTRAFGNTDANGQVTLTLEEGHQYYTWEAHTGSIGGNFYNIDGNQGHVPNTLAAVPAVWVLH